MIEREIDNLKERDAFRIFSFKWLSNLMSLRRHNSAEKTEVIYNRKVYYVNS